MENLSYRSVFQKQMQLHNKLKNQPNSKVHTLITCTHLPVFTLGKNADQQNIYTSPEKLNELGFEIVQTNRGGDVTYHGPGQLVVYPILNLNQLKMGAKKYVHLIEICTIKCLHNFGIGSETNSINPGVWIKNPWRKIAAIGIKISQGVTLHGLSLNVNTNLEHYRYINPCGLNDFEVTSIQKEIQAPIDEREIRSEFIRIFSKEFGYETI